MLFSFIVTILHEVYVIDYQARFLNVKFSQKTKNNET